MNLVSYAWQLWYHGVCFHVAYSYKFLRDVIFAVFADNLLSTKIESLTTIMYAYYCKLWLSAKFTFLENLYHTYK